MLLALYGTFFSDATEAAFSNYMLWWCAGLAIGFGYSNALCTDVKLYIVFSMLWVGILGYFGAEYVDRKEKRQVMDVSVDNETEKDEKL